MLCWSLSRVWLLVTPWVVGVTDFSVQGVLQARILEWVSKPSSRGSFQPTDRTQVSHIADRFFSVWATREALYMGCKIAKYLLFTEVHMGKCFGSYYVCACVCALVEDDLWRKISTRFACWRPRIHYSFHFSLQNRPVFLPDPLLCHTEPRQLTRGADIVSLRSSFNALVQSVHHTPPEIPQATHLAFPLKQSTERHPSNLED